MELLGPNLEELRTYCGGKFNLQTTLMLADQMITRLDCVHNNYYLHRDLKPNNFVIGRGFRLNVVYLVDFGLGKLYKDRKLGTHIPFKDKNQIVGTIRFASINAHYGMEQSRRDDLESLGYVLIYLIRGALPWQGMGKGDYKERSILQCKMNISIEKLCSGLPCIFNCNLAAFKTYLHKVKEMKFDQEPDYVFLSTLFRNLYYMKESSSTTLFCWIKRHVWYLLNL